MANPDEWYQIEREIESIEWPQAFKSDVVLDKSLLLMDGFYRDGEWIVESAPQVFGYLIRDAGTDILWLNHAHALVKLEYHMRCSESVRYYWFDGESFGPCSPQIILDRLHQSIKARYSIYQVENVRATYGIRGEAQMLWQAMWRDFEDNDVSLGAWVSEQAARTACSQHEFKTYHT